MPGFEDDLLSVCERLLRRRTGQRGKLSSARIRRSVSTAYHALFHFLLDEATRSLVGTPNDLRRRRRVLARTFSHNGIKTAVDKVRGASVDASVADLMRSRGAASGPVPSPAFARELASAFVDAQAKRHDADYDLNKDISASYADLLVSRIRRVIDGWHAADAPEDRDFKSALAMLMLIKGQLKREN